MINFFIADFISRLNVGKAINAEKINVKNTRTTLELLKILLNLNLIKDFNIIDDKIICVYMKFYKSKYVWKKMRLVSKPSKRVYVNLIKLQKMKSSVNNIYILSTDQGLKLDLECVLKKIGGEVLLKIEIS